MVDKFSDHTQGKELSQKLLGLVAALGETGMEVSMQPLADQEGDYVLRTPTCPYFDVARNHREICEMEQEMMAELLGPGVGVKLSNCIIDGKLACEFHVTSAPVNFEARKKEVTSVGVPE
jgi:predicted ArsR family transcriptional regulator